MFSKFSEDAQKILLGAKIEMSDLKHQYIGTEHLVLSMLKNDSVVKSKLNDYGINYNNFRSEIVKVIGIGNSNTNWYLYTPLVKRIIDNAIIISKEDKSNDVKDIHILLSLIEDGDGIANRIMEHMDIDLDDLYDDITSSLYDKSKSGKKLYLEEFGYSLNKKVLEGKIDPVIERDIEVKKIIEILSRRSKNNPLLVGEAGVGKTAIVEELARLIEEKKVPKILENKKIVAIELASLIAGTKYRGEFEERMNRIINELEDNEDIILFIDEIHTIMGAGGAEGAIDASNILKPALSRGKIKIIGATTLDEYKKTIEKDKAFERRFQKIYVEEPDFNKTCSILIKLKSIYESYHGVKIKDDLIKDIVKLSNKYIYDRKNPDKSIDILDEVCVRTSLKKVNKSEKRDDYLLKYHDLIDKKFKAIKIGNYTEAALLKQEEDNIIKRINKFDLNKKKNIKSVTLKDIKTVISEKSRIPIFEYEDNKDLINRFEKELKNNIIGQDDVIKRVVNIVKRIRCGLKIDNKPTSLLFVGPTGVGKTYLAKTISKYMFNKSNLIRLDMSEFREGHSISKLIGSPSGYVGYDDNKNRFEEVRNNPFSVILLDEIEKASLEVVNLFLQILDEGKITDASGRVIHFENTVIIMTSNLGYNKNSIGFNEDSSSIISKLNEYFSLEFINRINEVITFNKLDKESIKIIVKDKLEKIRNRLKDKNFNIDINSKLVNDIIDEINYKDFGARQIDLVINKKVYDILDNKSSVILRK